MKSHMKFKIKGWPQFDGRKWYTVRKIVKDKRYFGGYKVYTNESSCPIALGAIIKDEKSYGS